MYVELHTRSAFSFLEGVSVPEDLIATCKRYERPPMALIDTESPERSPLLLYMAAQKAALKSIRLAVTSVFLEEHDSGWPVEETPNGSSAGIGRGVTTDTPK